MLVLAEWAVARASLPKHLLEEQTILSLKLLSERFSESFKVTVHSFGTVYKGCQLEGGRGGSR